ncbi:MAG: Fic family protein [Candidatus Caenarcaniphilales bacterium]|nr:Fic family protein [Candidatus Caenarcaniphilales bacterium]
MSFNKDLPYNDLPLLPPSVDLETKLVLKKLIKAREALGRLDAANKRLPNELVLINSLTIQEAKLSSEIENIVTTNDELYAALASSEAKLDPLKKEVLNYPLAIWKGVDFIKENNFISTRMITDIVKTIKEQDSGIRKIPGTKIKNTFTGETIYTPPENEAVIKDKIQNLEKYINNNDDDIDPLVKMAVMHYQFEAIHPFHDGNGRTGRILNILFLMLNQLLDRPILFLSKYIIEHKAEYYERLKGVTESNEWEAWILFMLDAVELTSKYTIDKINSICDAIKETKDTIKSEAESIYSRDLVDVLFRLPYCKIKFLVDANIAKEKTASKYLKDLEAIGLLEKVKVGRENLYINKKFFEILRA